MRFSMEVLRRSVIFRGMGKGIGLGMCLYGADGLAKKGKKFNEILEFYYPGINIK
jgi:stage II sporulation protein D